MRILIDPLTGIIVKATINKSYVMSEAHKCNRLFSSVKSEITFSDCLWMELKQARQSLKEFSFAGTRSNYIILERI